MHGVQQRTLGRVEAWMMEFDVFLKAPSSVVGPGAAIVLPPDVVAAGSEFTVMFAQCPSATGFVPLNWFATVVTTGAIAGSAITRRATSRQASLSTSAAA